MGMTSALKLRRMVESRGRSSPSSSSAPRRDSSTASRSGRGAAWRGPTSGSATWSRRSPVTSARARHRHDRGGGRRGRLRLLRATCRWRVNLEFQIEHLKLSGRFSVINSTLRAFVTLCLAGGTALAQAPAAPAEAPLADLKVPEGFKISVFAGDLAGARLHGGQPRRGDLRRPPVEGRGRRPARPRPRRPRRSDEVVLSGLARPHSLAFHGGYVYVATNPAVLRVRYEKGKLAGEPEKVVDLPVSTTSHWTRTVGFGRTASSTSRSARPATSASRTTRGGRRSCATTSTAPGGRSSPRGCATRSASTGSPADRGALRDRQRARQARRRAARRTRSTASSDGEALRLAVLHRRPRARPRPQGRRRRPDRAGSSRPCSSCGAHSAPLGLTFYDGTHVPRPPTGARSSSRCTARGTARRRSATRSSASSSTAADRHARSRS